MPPIGGDPMAIEGYRTIAYEIAEELRWTAPDLVLVPAALGDGIQGIWRGFRDLVTWAVIDRIPRMVAVEVAGAVAAALASGKDWVAPSGALESPARALAGVTGTVQSLHAVVESEGLVVRVSESELEHARMQLGELEGMWTDLAAAAPVAAAIKLAQRGDVPTRTVVVPVLTEHGAMDGSSGDGRAARDGRSRASTSFCACSPCAASRVWRSMAVATNSHRNYIAGEWVDSESGEQFENRQPRHGRAARLVPALDRGATPTAPSPPPTRPTRAGACTRRRSGPRSSTASPSSCATASPSCPG